MRILCPLIMLVCSHLTAAVSIRTVDIPFIAAAYSQSQPDIMSLLAHYPEFANAKDEFERGDQFQKLKPKVEARIKEMRDTKEFEASFKVVLSEYDFETETFGLDWKGPDIGMLQLELWGLVTHRIHVSKDDARNIVSRIGSNRQLEAKVTGWMKSPLARFHVFKLEVFDYKGMAIAQHTAYQSPPGSYKRAFPVGGLVPYDLHSAMKGKGAWWCWKVYDAKGVEKGVINMRSVENEMIVDVSHQIRPIKAGDWLETGNRWGARLPLSEDVTGFFPWQIVTKFTVLPGEWIDCNISQEFAVFFVEGKGAIDVYNSTGNKPKLNAEPHYVIGPRKATPVESTSTYRGRETYPHWIYLRAQGSEPVDVFMAQKVAQYHNPKPLPRPD